jgi:hypothetical protein
MKTNDIRKGMRFRLRNGWDADMADNKKGNIRMAKVYGTFTEIGSVYAHDIVSVRTETGWLPVEHTPAQIRLKKLVGLETDSRSLAAPEGPPAAGLRFVRGLATLAARSPP